MSLRLRAVLLVGLALVVLWASAAAWMMRGVHANLERTLDVRLAMSARMVSGLLQRAALSPPAAPSHWSDVMRIGGADGIACEIRSMQGSVLAQTEGAPQAGPESLPLGYSTREVDGQPWRIYLLQDERGYQIMTADRIDMREALVAGMRRATGIPFLIATVGGLLALWIGIGRGLSPLEILRHTLRNRRADDTTPIDSGHAPAELAPLVDALNGLLERLARTLADQRAFTDAAAHELRTPLTAIDTHLQVARLAEGDVVRQSLQHAGEGVERLRRTLEQMMALVRTEAPAAPEDACPSVVAVIEELTRHLGAADAQRVNCHVHGRDHDTPVPRSLLETSLRNLLDNALRYSPADRPVALYVSFDQTARQATLAVSDHGPGLDAEQWQRIGQRFWRGDQGRGPKDGAGLGLSIVHAIAARVGGELTLRARDGGGLVARLRIPLH